MERTGSNGSGSGRDYSRGKWIVTRRRATRTADGIHKTGHSRVVESSGEPTESRLYTAVPEEAMG